jgi:hypothetical protein
MAAEALGRQWNPPTTDMRSSAYADYHREHFAPVRAEQRAHQIGAVKRELGNARAASQKGDRAGAARAQKRAATERSIAARTPR